MEDDSPESRLERVAPLLPLLVGALGIVAERGGAIPAPVAIAATAVAAVAAVWVLTRRAVRRRSVAEGERHRLAARLERIEDRDTLTGVCNHRRLDEEIRRQLELLIASAEALIDELRATDVVARCEPHGFVVVIPQTDEDAVRIVAGKLIRRGRSPGGWRPGPIAAASSVALD